MKKLQRIGCLQLFEFIFFCLKRFIFYSALPEEPRTSTIL